MTQSQMTLLQAMDFARAHHHAGRLREAESICRQILAVQPENGDALQCLGAIALLVGNFPAAVNLFERAIHLRPNDAALFCGLGDALDAEGKVDQAIAAYEQAVERKSPEGHNNLGVVYQRTGSSERALAEFRAALDLRPDFPQAMSNLGECLRSIGQVGAAIDMLRALVRAAPAFPDAHHNLGLALRDEHKYDDAAAALRQAVALRPNFASALNDLGETLRLQGEFDAAIKALKQALAITPDMAAAHSNLGTALQAKGLLEESIDAYGKALALLPNSAETLNNLGNALHAMERSDEAIDAYQRAIALRPDFGDAHHNLGIVLERLDRPEEALAAYEGAIHFRPEFSESYNNRGSPLHALGRFEEAIQSLRRAIDLEPDYILAHYNLALTLLLLGRFEEAWPEHEWRCRTPELAKVYKDFQQPTWDGSDPAGKRMLLYVEQGFGDTIHFIRYVPLLAQRGAKVIVGCRPALERLLRSVEGIDQLILDGSPLPSFDLHCSLLSLPHFFCHNCIEDLPANIPYIKAEPQLVEHWRQRLALIGPRLKVGLVWAGGSAHANDRNRSIPLSMLSPLAQASGVQFIALQKGPPADQANNPPPGMDLLDVSNELNDFSDTAAVIDNLDLVISVDTSVAHLAAALGKPVWLLVAFVPDWRWMLNRPDSPWYPTMKLFRQQERGKWDEPIERIQRELIAMLRQ